jgi:hypothetical protein
VDLDQDTGLFRTFVIRSEVQTKKFLQDIIMNRHQSGTCQYEDNEFTV